MTGVTESPSHEYSSLRNLLRFGRSKSPSPRGRRHSEGKLQRWLSRSRSPSPVAGTAESESSGEEETTDVRPANNFQEDSDSDDEDAALGPIDQGLLANTVRNKGLTSVFRHLQEQASPTSPITRKRKENLSLEIDKPVFQRNRCTIAIRHGDPVTATAQAKRTRSYFLASDLSSESEFALEWAVGTVLRSGDTFYTISVVENEDRLDGENDAIEVKQIKQRERLHRAQAVQRQVVGLLERTRLHVTVIVQVIHAANARHMLIDTIDFLEPTLVIVGSRGLTKVKTVLLGSVSSYLVQKSSSPVMVARRRLRMPSQHTPKSELNRQPRARLDEAEIEVESKPISGEEVDGDAADDEGTTEPPRPSDSREDVGGERPDILSEVLRRSSRDAAAQM